MSGNAEHSGASAKALRPQNSGSCEHPASFVHLSCRLEALKSNPPFFVAYAGAKNKKWYFQCRSCERRIGSNEEESAECLWRLRVSRDAGGFVLHCTVGSPETGHLANDRMTGRLQGTFTASEERAVYDLVKAVGPAAKTSDVRCAIHQAPTRGTHRRDISHHAIMRLREKIFRYPPKNTPSPEPSRKPATPLGCCRCPATDCSRVDGGSRESGN